MCPSSLGLIYVSYIQTFTNINIFFRHAGVPEVSSPSTFPALNRSSCPYMHLYDHTYQYLPNPFSPVNPRQSKKDQPHSQSFLDKTETEGFEPSCPFGQTDFESVSLRPLRYVSKYLSCLKQLRYFITNLNNIQAWNFVFSGSF